MPTMLASLAPSWHWSVAKMTAQEMVKHLRSTLHLTQAELAKALGVEVETVKFWEAGRRNPGPTPIAKMSVMMQPRSVRAVRLSEGLAAAADLADANVAASIADGDPEGADSAQRLAGHLRRLASTHREMDPVQIAPLEQT